MCVSSSISWRGERNKGLEGARGEGKWVLGKQHPYFLIGSKTFSLPKILQENSPSLIKRGLLWLKKETEVRKPLRGSPEIGGFFGTPLKNPWSLCTL